MGATPLGATALSRPRRRHDRVGPALFHVGTGLWSTPLWRPLSRQCMARQSDTIAPAQKGYISKLVLEGVCNKILIRKD